MAVGYGDVYQKMAEQLREEGYDERAIELFVTKEMEGDERRDRDGVTERAAWRRWRELPATSRYILLTQATCRNCGPTSIEADYSVRCSTMGLVVEGTCSKCGARIAYARDETKQ